MENTVRRVNQYHWNQAEQEAIKNENEEAGIKIKK
jgi:hypothetical protein